jgi:CheY-like chemotaxis protein
LVLLNYLMPGLHGLEVLRRLRLDPPTAGIKVIMDSARPIGKEASHLGAQDFIKLPYDVSTLLGKITRVLRA